MAFSISTHWNAARSASGEHMIEQILSLGITSIELGYDTTIDLVPGVQNMMKQKSVTVSSVHNFCPVPMGAPFGHPELFSLSSPDSRIRDSAVIHTRRTIEFAAEMGAKAVVVHAGNVEMKHMTPELIDMYHAGLNHTEACDKVLMKLLIQRSKKAPDHITQLYRSIEDLMPALSSSGIRMAFENLPSWESIPTENELEKILEHFGTSHLGYWHDMGHGQIRQNLGFIGHKRWFEKLSKYLVGMHIHDVMPPAMDHIMPPNGKIAFEDFKSGIKPDTLLVLEPAPGLPSADILAGMKIISEAWRQ